MVFGLGTYAFHWQASDAVEVPLSLEAMVETTHGLECGVFQICDYPAISSMPKSRMSALARRAAELGVKLELGIRGVGPDQLREALRIAQILDATTVRTLLFDRGEVKTMEQAEQDLLLSIHEFEGAGIVLALETYERSSSSELVSIVERIQSDFLGICLDPANTVAALEQPSDVIARCSPHVRNIHLKDFQFTRNDGWVGFQLTGACLGEGLLDVENVLACSQTSHGPASVIVEHWLPWQENSRVTVEMERRWTQVAIDYLKGRS